MGKWIGPYPLNNNMKKHITELLTLIEQNANSSETKADPELDALFKKFNSQKNHNLNKALIDLKTNINLYQLEYNYQTPKFLTRIVLNISEVNNVNDGVGIGAFFSNLWFGH